MTGLLRGALCAMAVGVVGIGAARANIMVDDFTQSIGPVWPQVQTVSTAGGAAETESGLSQVLGNVRGYVVKSATIGVSGLDQLSSNVFHNGTASVFDYSSSVGASGKVELFYGDKNANPLNVAGVTGVTINFSNYDVADGQPLFVNVTLTNRLSPGVWITSSAVTGDFSGGATSSTATGFLPSPATVDAIQLDFNAPAGADFRVDSITLVAVPEPASLGMMGVGALMLLKRRR